MKHISLFSGIGGFDLAATWAGWDNIVSCEINPFCNKVLKYYWPNAYHHNDIKTLTYEKINENLSAGWDGPNIVISGGFPCQPYSFAGKRKGKDDDRHLWPEMLRVIRELQPRWVVGENVFGLVNWDGGLVFDEVQSDLEAEGYEVQPYVLPACAVNAPHRRDRVWFVALKDTNENGWRSEQRQSQSDQWKQRNAITGNYERICTNDAKTWFAAYAKGDKNQRHRQGGFFAEPSGLDEQGFITNPDNTRRSTRPGEVQSKDEEVSQWDDNAEFGDAGAGIIANAESIGNAKLKRPYKKEENRLFDNYGGIEHAANACKLQLQRSEFNRGIGSQGATEGKGGQSCRSICSTWQEFPTQPPICGGDDGLSTGLDGIAFSKWRNESIKAYGNAVVPQVVYQIFKAINEYEERARMGLV